MKSACITKEVSLQSVQRLSLYRTIPELENAKIFTPESNINGVFYKVIATDELPLKENKVYSVMVALCEDGIVTQTKFMYDISRSLEDAASFIKLLCDNCVTPDTTEYILQDWLGV